MALPAKNVNIWVSWFSLVLPLNIWVSWFSPSWFSPGVLVLCRSGTVIAIDDFGAGYSGLNLLADIQPDWIKLDMYLLRNIEQHGARQSIVKAICSVCLDLGIDVLAEGVETLEELRFLEKLDISLYQGYFFAKPGFETLPTVSESLRSINAL